MTSCWQLYLGHYNSIGGKDSFFPENHVTNKRTYDVIKGINHENIVHPAKTNPNVH